MSTDTLPAPLLLQGKRILVVGVANDHSLAWGIAQALHVAGAELAFSYGAANLERRVAPLATSVGAAWVAACDVTQDHDIAALFDTVAARWGRLDGLIHAVAFAERDDLKNRFADTSREGFRLALDISAYSLVALARGAEPLMIEGGGITTLSYYGAEKVLPGYNVMGVAKAALEASVRYLAWDLGPRGIRVNAISAGPVRTLSSSAVSGFRDMLRLHAARAPLRRNVGLDDVGGAAVFLASDHAAGVTGEVLHVDAGYNIVGI